ncbi:MAG: fibronectin type III domain-containing protein [Eubacterium sp.]|nr:fibronectin type III domain-containing protein [Eubacterium sp.]
MKKKSILKKTGSFILAAFIAIAGIGAGGLTAKAATVAKTTITSLEGSEESFTVSFKKVSNVTGYQIRYSTEEDMSNAVKKTLRSTSYTFSDIEGDMTYYVQVRVLKRSGNTKTYSKWCTKESVYVEAASETESGGWEINTEFGTPEIPDEVQEAFDKAMENLVGVDYTPVLYLGSQVVAGMNYKLICTSTVVYPGAETTYSIVTIYADLEGNCEVTDITELEW